MTHPMRRDSGGCTFLRSQLSKTCRIVLWPSYHDKEVHMKMRCRATKSQAVDKRLLAEFERVEHDPRESTRRAIAAIISAYAIPIRY